MNMCHVTVLLRAHTLSKCESAFQGPRTDKKLFFLLMKAERGLVNSLARSLGGLHVLIHFSDSVLSIFLTKSTRLRSLWSGYSLLLLTYQKDMIPLLVQSTLYYIGEHPTDKL